VSTPASRGGRLAIGLAVVAALAAPAAGNVRSPDGFVERLRQRVRTALERAAGERGALRPPVPVAVIWKPRRLASLDLGAPLLAMAAGDLDGDGRAEVAAVTERDVVVLAARDRRALAEIARAPLPAEPPSIRPRDAVGAAVVVPATAGRGELWARSSTAARGARYTHDGGALREVAPVAGFPLCAGTTLELVPGRNTFAGTGGLPPALLGLACRSDLVDGSGRRLTALAALDTGGALAVTTTTVARSQRFVLAGVGTAFAIADVDRAGPPAGVHAGAGAPGDADAVAVHTLPRAGTDGPLAEKPVFRRGFSGGVAAIVAADVDGDGDLEVMAAVRLAGAQRVDLWLLN
jgi:hypothetical protein